MDRALLTKAAIVAALALVLLVPVGMIRDLIAERQARANEAVAGIALGWGRRQTLAGPFLAVPYERSWTEVAREVVDGTTKERSTEKSEALVLRLPVDLIAWTVSAETSEKSRGIYKARLYGARIKAEGTIAIPERFGIPEAASRIKWGNPRLVLGVSDPRGIRSVTPLSVDGREHEFLPGAGDAALASGVHAVMEGFQAAAGRTIAFGFALELAGSEAFGIVPLGRDTTVAMRADWPHPSFQGVFLPARQEIGAEGFSAHWQVSRYAAQVAERLAACANAKPCPMLLAQELGVSFIEPAGLYQRLERSAKYGFLFIGLTFAAFLMLELLRRLPIHPIQYALVGLALAIFFLLLAALSEHVAFGLAYAAATLACTGLVAAYVGWAMRSAIAGAAFGTALGGLYGVLYMLVQAEDFALLAGAVLLFALLAGAMLATRRVDWYQLARAQSAAG